MICILSGHEHHAAIHRKACIVQYPSRTYLLIVLSKNFVSNVCHFTLRSRVDHGWLPRTQRWATLTRLSIKLPVVSSHNIFIDVVNAGLNHEFHAVFVIICHVFLEYTYDGEVGWVYECSIIPALPPGHHCTLHWSGPLPALRKLTWVTQHTDTRWCWCRLGYLGIGWKLKQFKFSLNINDNIQLLYIQY